MAISGMHGRNALVRCFSGNQKGRDFYVKEVYRMSEPEGKILFF